MIRLEAGRSPFFVPTDADGRPVLMARPDFDREFFAGVWPGVARHFTKENLPALLFFRECGTYPRAIKVGGKEYYLSGGKPDGVTYSPLTPRGVEPRITLEKDETLKNSEGETEWMIKLSAEKRTQVEQVVFGKTVRFDCKGVILSEARELRLPNDPKIGFGDSRVFGIREIFVTYHHWFANGLEIVSTGCLGQVNDALVSYQVIVDASDSLVVAPEVSPLDGRVSIPRYNTTATEVATRLLFFLAPAIVGKKLAMVGSQTKPGNSV